MSRYQAEMLRIIDGHNMLNPMFMYVIATS